ncbi:MAG TPA: T9SS-dependent M36 family metallopeptidase [Flavobacteriales bacterium]|nr:T9SS-dependent M36 family metallopeptidase [Flavobacteriales bacterium]
MKFFPLRVPVFLVAFSTLPMGLHAQDASGTVRQWLQEHAAEHGLSQQDAAAWEVTDQYTDKQGRTFLYVRQTANGLPVDGGTASFVLAEGHVRGIGDRLQGHLADRVASPVPALPARDALRSAALHLGLGMPGEGLRQVDDDGLLIDGGELSKEPVPVRLVYRVVEGRSDIPLAWSFVIREHGGRHWWHVAVDANTGEVLWKNDRITHCSFPDDAFARGYRAMDDLAMPAAAMGGAGAGYRVFPYPTESPMHGPQEWVTDPADQQASPFGWHDTNGVPGAEYTITRGNNVYAGEDFNDDDVIGYSPDGGPSLNFDHPYDQSAGPAGYLDAAITNLFHACNVLHDVWYHYGFDEPAGNFQHHNYTGQGNGGDAVLAQAQDGGGMNNANFATPPDGAPGAMQMYLWRTSEGDSLIVHSPASVAGNYTVMTGSFGPVLASPGATAELVLVQDNTPPASDGCETIMNGAALAGKIAVVDRGTCTFIAKVQALEAVGALAVVVVNNTGGAPITMGGEGPDIGIPSVMVSQSNGQLLKNAMLQGPVMATLSGPGLASLRDGDLDNGVIAHEYGHGISNRLTGGPDNADCLWNAEQMGEGWSDWMAMVLTMREGDQPEMPRGMANFVLDAPIDGTGLRPAPYSTDMAVNPYKYGSSNTFSFQGAHALGFLWATMLWDMTWALIQEEGFDPDMYHGTGGNNTAMRLVMDGMKLQPCSPGFVDGRDAILLADELNYGGVHQCIIWNAFARRGLGYSASQGSSDALNDQVEAFDVPANCLGVHVAESGPTVPAGLLLFPNPAVGQVVLQTATALHGPTMARLMGTDGRVVKEVAFSQAASMEIDLHGVAPGLYVVQLEADGLRMQQRLVVQ